MRDKPRVYRLRGWTAHIGIPPKLPMKKCWVAVHPAGIKAFDTWREALDYACTPWYGI